MPNPYPARDHVFLRPLGAADAPELTRWIDDPEIARAILTHRPIGARAEESFLAELEESRDEVALGIALEEGHRLIGVCGLTQRDHRSRHAMFGIFLGEKSEWGKGYGSLATRLMVRHAFETLYLRRVWLHVRKEHAAAIRAYEKAGFRREGVLQGTFLDEQGKDVFLMACMRDDDASPETRPNLLNHGL